MIYIPGIKCNILRIGQLFERNYKIHMENKVLSVIDANVSLILEVPIDQNKNFKVELKLIKHRCLVTTASREESI